MSPGLLRVEGCQRAEGHNGAMTAITDVPGIRVGHATRTADGWLSGVTVVLPPPGTAGSVDVRGGGPGTHETDALDPTTLTARVDAVVLTGGSAYGLLAAHGAQRWCEEDGRGFPVTGGVVPIVPAAAIFDLGRGGDFTARPDLAMGYEATAAAAAREFGHDVERGNVGAGTGAAIGRGQFKGGVGTASVTLENISGEGSVVVGAISSSQRAGTAMGHIAATGGTRQRASKLGPRRWGSRAELARRGGRWGGTSEHSEGFGCHGGSRVGRTPWRFSPSAAAAQHHPRRRRHQRRAGRRRMQADRIRVARRPGPGAESEPHPG
ncbi:L-aminopeptidase/D-esterase-like protein [Arthrobacter sp. V4I6]|nr:L-aminopeptidase/D-esterase-like protein [Arthrobacter sp. V4I6]